MPFTLSIKKVSGSAASKMKTAEILIFLAISFTSIIAAPPRDGEEKSLLVDIISGRIGVNISSVVAQAEATRKGLQRIGQETRLELENIFSPYGPEAVSEVRNITDDAIAQSKAIIEPVFKLSNEILQLIGNGTLEDVKEIERTSTILIIIRLCHNLIQLFEITICDLKTLVANTIYFIQKLIQKIAWVGDKLAAAVNCLCALVLPSAAKEVQPLLEILVPVLKPREPSEDFEALTKAILGLDVVVIGTQINFSLKGLHQLFRSSASELKEILVSSGIDAKKEIDTIIDDARAQAETLLRPVTLLIDLIVELLPARKVHGAGFHRDTLDTIITLIVKMISSSLEQFRKLLVVDTIHKLVEVAKESGANTTGKIEELAGRTMTEAKALIRPLFKLLSPIAPDSVNKIDDVPEKPFKLLTKL